MELKRHWTSRSVADFVYRIGADFVCQLETKMESDGTTNKKLAALAGVSEGRLSQVLNNPGNLTLKSTVQYAQALGLKVALVAYEDPKDPTNSSGPVNSEIFSVCWKDAGSPRDYFDLAGSNVNMIMLADPPKPAANLLYKAMGNIKFPQIADATRISKVVN